MIGDRRTACAACVDGMSVDLKRLEDTVDQLLAACPECAKRTYVCGRCGRPVGSTPAETEEAVRVIMARLNALSSRYEMSKSLAPEDDETEAESPG